MRPLHWACSKGQITTVRYLFTLGCSLEAPEARGQTPLMLAAQGEHGVLLQWLLQRGVDVTKLDRDGDSALHWAACARPRPRTAKYALNGDSRQEAADGGGAPAPARARAAAHAAAHVARQTRAACTRSTCSWRRV